MDAYPIPHMDEVIDQLGKAKYSSTLNLWQVPVDLNAQHILHHLVYTMPFGLSGAPATFQCMMDQVTKERDGRVCSGVS